MLRDHWKIAVVLAVQFAVLVAIPMRTLRTRTEGVDVTLWTAPVDPFDVLAGYYVTLGYEAERPPSGVTGPDPQHKGDDLWVTVHRGDPAWTPVSVTRERPDPQPDRIAMRATWNGWQAQITNAGRLYIPETQREDVEKALDAVDRRGLVDLRLDADGNVAVLRLRADGKTFGDEP